jgi:hypothetical protein
MTTKERRTWVAIAVVAALVLFAIAETLGA